MNKHRLKVLTIFFLLLSSILISCGKKELPKTDVVLQTTEGDIEIKLFTDIAPKTCENFVGLIEKNYYDNTLFHRVIKNFMIQGGDPTGTGKGGESLWGGTFADEVSDKISFDRKGLVAMANRGPNTNGSQFFITTGPSPALNNRYTIFGEVINGYNVVEKIENTQTGPGDRPVIDQILVNAYVK